MSESANISRATHYVAMKIANALPLDALKHKVFGRTRITVVLDEEAAKEFLREHVGSEHWQPQRGGRIDG